MPALGLGNMANAAEKLWRGIWKAAGPARGMCAVSATINYYLLMAKGSFFTPIRYTGTRGKEANERA